MTSRIAALFVAIVALSAVNVQATLIDSFDTGAQSLSVSHSLPVDSSQVNPGTSSVIGGYRDVSLDWVSGSKSYLDVLTPPDGTGGFFTEGAGEATTSVTWDGANTPSVLSYALAANLTVAQENTFLVDIAQVTGGGLGLTLTVYTDATHVSTYTTLAATNGILSVPYSSFSSVGTSGAADFSNVGAIVMELSGVGHAGADMAINSVQTSAVGVPEPATLVMLAIAGMVFLGGRRWRKA